MQIDDDFQLWHWETLRELQSNRFLLLGVLQLSRRPDGHVSAWEQHLQLFSLLPHVNQIQKDAFKGWFRKWDLS